jgi:hypothetical protein
MVTPRRPQVGVPRQFGIGTMMVLATMFAVVCAVLKTIGSPPVGFAIVLIFLVWSALCQAVLFKGKNPRRASIIGGMALYPVMSIVAVAAMPPDRPPIWAWPFIIPVSAIIGGAYGYAAGCLVAAVFLVWKERDESQLQPHEAERRGGEATGHELAEGSKCGDA